MTCNIPSNVNASSNLEPPTKKTAANTIGIPPNNNALNVGPPRQLEKYIPSELDNTIAKKI
jgi:hypothetical protein